MIISISMSELKQYLSTQLSTFFPDKYKFEGGDVDRAFKLALERLEYCFKYIAYPSYHENNEVKFNHLHSDQYCHFLWFVSNSLWKESQNQPLCDKLIALNKSLNSILITYKVNLPNIFLLGHAVGSIIGDAKFNDYLVILQNVTINQANGSDGRLPLEIGKGVFLGPGSKIIGGGKIGDFTSLGANVLLYNPHIDERRIAYVDKDGLKIKNSDKKPYALNYFNIDI